MDITSPEISKELHDERLGLLRRLDQSVSLGNPFSQTKIIYLRVKAIDELLIKHQPPVY